jgi:hypothetical protein
MIGRDGLRCIAKIALHCIGAIAKRGFYKPFNLAVQQ